MTEHETLAPAAPAAPAPAEGEPDTCVDPAAVLAFVREEAARIDPAHTYQTATPRRIKNAGWTAYDFMQAHLQLHRLTGRKARSGKRAHAAEVRRLLEGTNDADLTLAVALLVAAVAMLPPDAPRRD